MCFEVLITDKKALDKKERKKKNSFSVLESQLWVQRDYIVWNLIEISKLLPSNSLHANPWDRETAFQHS